MRIEIKGKFKYLLIAGLILFILITSIYFFNKNSKTPVSQSLPLVRTQTVKASDSMQSNTYSGEVTGRYTRQLSFMAGGKIIKRNIDIGSSVRAGDLLMQLDAQNIQENIDSVKAQVSAYQSQAKLAEDNLNRYQKLYEIGAISQVDYQNMQNSSTSAEAALKQVTAQYNQLMIQMDNTCLYANVPGKVTSITIETGQAVSAGQPVLTLVQDGEREVTISVPENRINQLRQATKVQVKFWALPNIVLPGEIREIDPAIDSVTHTYKAKISLANIPDELQLGMTASVTVSTPSEQISSIYIPLSAIYQPGDVPQVWVVHEGVLHLAPVTVSHLGNSEIQIISGLNDGDLIVTAGVHKLYEGMKVQTAGDVQ